MQAAKEEAGIKREADVRGQRSAAFVPRSRDYGEPRRTERLISTWRFAFSGRYWVCVYISESAIRISKRGKSNQAPSPSEVETVVSRRFLFIMKAELVKAASEVITNQQILVNMISRRVRQLCLGHRPLVEFAPGLGHADIALTEIANGKLMFESTFGQNGKVPADVVQFPGIIVEKKVPKKKAA